MKDLDRLVRVAKERAADRRRAFAWSPDGGVAQPVDPRPPRGRPLRVLQSDGGRTLFHYLADERLEIAVQAPGAGLEAPPDVVVINRADRMPLEESAADLPREVWAGAAEGRLRVVFDVCGEGAGHDWRRSRRLHEFLGSRGLRPSMAAYVTQDRSYADDYGAVCDRKGLGADRMQIWVHDLYIRRTFADVGLNGEQLFEQRLAAYARRAPRAARLSCR